jgi:hypothetical protein
MFNDAQAVIDELALAPQFNNTAREIVFGVIPRGAQLIMGYAAAQGTLSGGAFQIVNYANALITTALME